MLYMLQLILKNTFTMVNHLIWLAVVYTGEQVNYFKEIKSVSDLKMPVATFYVAKGFSKVKDGYFSFSKQQITGFSLITGQLVEVERRNFFLSKCCMI